MTAPQSTPRMEQLTIDGCQITVRFPNAPSDARLQAVQAALLNAGSHICASPRRVGEWEHPQ